MATTPPRWDLSNVYPGLDSPTLAKDINWVKEATEAIRQLYQEKLVKVDATSSPKEINEALSKPCAWGQNLIR
jgi:predicted AlkP superfamily phosphohydrolase/phosphomutase